MRGNECRPIDTGSAGYSSGAICLPARQGENVSADLEQIEAQLRAHFERLAAAKRPNNQPLFALEHCLGSEEVVQMRGLLRASIRHNGMSAKFKHCWLVHAAEHGYTFDGLEFWPSFAEQTPHWTYFGDRETLRGWFAHFAKQHNGACPRGSWAQHFRYIAWPITHALLPSDLQIQLAHALYQLRYRLDELIQLEDEAAGKMLARHVEWPTTRLKHFLEQHELVGRLIRTLLDVAPDEPPSIYLPTLERITSDLNAKSQARAWLHDARKYVNRFTAKLGTANPRYALIPPAKTQDEESARAEIGRQGVLLRPRLVLQRIGTNRWNAQLLIPSFQPLVNLKPQFRDHLARTRYNVTDHGDALYLGRSLLSGRPAPRHLITWPREQTSVLRFTQAETTFDRIVAAECQFPFADLWIFRCIEDEVARQVQGQHVRAGQTYLVVAKDAHQLEGLGEAIELNCAGVSAIRLVVPDAISSELITALGRAKIGVRSRVLIEPVGLRPRQWSEAGVGEWLSTETPLFALRCEHEVDLYQIQLNEEKPYDVRRTGETTLIALRDLPVGCHRVSISAVKLHSSAFGTRREPTSAADIELYVRHPTSWSPRTQLPTAMVVDVIPPFPSLEDLLAQRVQLRADGDESRTATCSLSLSGPISGSETVFQIHTQRLPIPLEAWQRQLAGFLDNLDELKLLNISQACIVVDAEDLGAVRIPLLIEVEPLRWAIKRSKQQATLFLIDEGVTEDVSVTFHGFDQPLQSAIIDAQVAAQGIDCTSREGLYVARAGKLEVAIAVALQERAHGLAALGAQVGRAELANESSLGQLLDSLRTWRSARVSSYMAKLKRNSVCQKIWLELIRRVCGERWLSREHAFDRDCNCDNKRALESAVSRHPSFAISLAREWIANNSSERFDALKGCFEPQALRYGITRDTKLIELAWRFASNPTDIDGAALMAASRMEHFGVLAKGARLLILLQEKQWEPT